MPRHDRHKRRGSHIVAGKRMSGGLKVLYTMLLGLLALMSGAMAAGELRACLQYGFDYVQELEPGHPMSAGAGLALAVGALVGIGIAIYRIWRYNEEPRLGRRWP